MICCIADGHTELVPPLRAILPRVPLAKKVVAVFN